jgi:hypothetical protein
VEPPVMVCTDETGSGIVAESGLIVSVTKATFFFLPVIRHFQRQGYNQYLPSKKLLYFLQREIIRPIFRQQTICYSM